MAADSVPHAKTPDGSHSAGRVAPISFSDLLVAPKVPSLSLRDLLADPTPARASTAVIVRRPRAAVAQTVFQVRIPLATPKLGPDREAWFLRCFCDIDAELGNMIQCEKCLNWQHELCVRLNANTTPMIYFCPACSAVHVRCCCEDNLNYRLTLIKCSKCGYWVHKRCEGLGAGPYYTDGHVCRQCGGSPSKPPDVSFPYHTRLPNPVVAIDQQALARLHPSVWTAPFASFLKSASSYMSAFKFCEHVYNEFRPFFYLTHSQVTTSSPKKRRGDVCSSFFRAVFYVLESLWDIEQDAAVRMFDLLAKLDVYLAYELPSTLLPSAASALECSELARLELDKAKHIPDVPQAQLPHDLIVRGDGIYCQSALQPEQLIAIVAGFVAVADEFTYENGVDSRFYVVCGTKFVIDTHKNAPQLVHNFRRSLSPNCVMKIVRCQGLLYAVVSAGVSDVNGIAKRTRREKFPIPANSELLLPIDFAPATIDEPLEFINWHFDEIEVQPVEPPSSPPSEKAPPRAPSPPKHQRPSREEREEAAMIRQVDRAKKQKRKPKEEQASPRVKKRPGKPPKSPKHVEVAELTLFSLIRSFNPEPYLFSLPAQGHKNVDRLDAAADLHQDAGACYDDVDCSFLNHLLCEEAAPFVPLRIADPIQEMLQIVDLTPFD
jgi:hypothetical protein